MTTIRKLLRNQIDELTIGELRQAIIHSEETKYDYINLYNEEYKRSKILQQRVDKLKNAQRAAHLPFNGIIE